MMIQTFRQFNTTFFVLSLDILQYSKLDLLKYSSMEMIGSDDSLFMVAFSQYKSSRIETNTKVSVQFQGLQTRPMDHCQALSKWHSEAVTGRFTQLCHSRISFIYGGCVTIIVW